MNRHKLKWSRYCSIQMNKLQLSRMLTLWTYFPNTKTTHNTSNTHLYTSRVKSNTSQMKREGSSISLVIAFIKHYFDSVWNTCSHTHVLEWQRTLIAKVQARLLHQVKVTFKALKARMLCTKTHARFPLEEWSSTLKTQMIVGSE